MPILAKAVFKFEGAQSDDLSFDEDDIVTILAKDDSGACALRPSCARLTPSLAGWWTGKTEDGREGDFPFNYGAPAGHLHAPQLTPRQWSCWTTRPRRRT
jgi:hypothetical protein